MRIEPEIPFAVIPFIFIAGIFSLIYSLYGALSVYFMIGNTRPHGWGDIYGLVFMLLPLFAFPIYLSSLYSIKNCRNWFTAYFVVDLMIGMGIIFEGFSFHKLFTIPRIAVILATVMLNAAYLLVRHALRGSNEKIPGIITIMRR
jgi:hypothetical protein